jgi:hypothetical protein
MTDEQVNSVNAYSHAEALWIDTFGEPDYFSSMSDVNDAQIQYDILNEEFISLQSEIEQRDTVTQYKLNRVVALHFMILSGDDYMTKILDVVYEGTLETELEGVNIDDTISDTKKYPWEN